MVASVGKLVTSAFWIMMTVTNSHGILELEET